MAVSAADRTKPPTPSGRTTRLPREARRPGLCVRRVPYALPQQVHPVIEVARVARAVGDRNDGPAPRRSYRMRPGPRARRAAGARGHRAVFRGRPSGPRQSPARAPRRPRRKRARRRRAPLSSASALPLGPTHSGRGPIPRAALRAEHQAQRAAANTCLPPRLCLKPKNAPAASPGSHAHNGGVAATASEAPSAKQIPAGKSGAFQ